MKNFLAIVLARKGSQGIKNKNLLKIKGKHLFFWPINAALKSKYVKKVVLSTDSKKIAKIGKQYGADVPFLRPKKYSRNTSSSFEAINHCIKFLRKRKEYYDNFILLEPTSPLTTFKDLNNAIKKFLQSKSAKAMVSVAQAISTNPVFLCKLGHKGLIKPYKRKKFLFKRRQSIEKVYFFDGSLYISDVKYYLKKKSFNHFKTKAFIMPKVKSYEIDDIYDYKIIKHLKNEIRTL